MALNEKQALADFPKTDAAFAAHKTQIDEIQLELHFNREEIQDALDLIEDEKAQHGQASRTRSSRKTNMLGSIFQEKHIYCELAQRVYHTIARMMYDRGMMSTPVRKIVLKAISTRLSILNFPVEKKPMDHRETIRRLDHACGEAGVTSLTPYLFTPNSTLTEFKQLLAGERFSAVDILATLGQLFTDTHVLHSLCMCMASSGMPEEIPVFLQNEAKRRNVPLQQFLSQEKDLVQVYLVGLVEGGKSEVAVEFAVTVMPLIYASEGAAEKYAAALRVTGQFDAAITFLEEAKKRGLKSNALGVQFMMARQKDRNVLPQKLK